MNVDFEQFEQKILCQQPSEFAVKGADIADFLSVIMYAVKET